MWRLWFVALAVSATCPFSGSTSADGPCPRKLTTDSTKGQQQQTVRGCTCSSQCSASEQFTFACDWCRTEDGCGTLGLGGHWDYCDYSLDPSYVNKSWSEKLDMITSKMLAYDAEHAQAQAYPSPLGLFTESVVASFDDWRDEMPAGRVKYVHSVGALCDVELAVTAASPYTGLFGPGSRRASKATIS